MKRHNPHAFGIVNLARYCTITQVPDLFTNTTKNAHRIT